MKKITNYLKTLLVAAMVMVGSSAWADNTSLYERGTTNAWSDADLSDWAASYVTPTIDGGIKGSTSNAGWTVTKTFSFTKNSIVTLNATLKTGGASGRSGSYDYIKIGGIIVGFNEQDKVAFVNVDGASSNLSLTYSRATAYAIQVVINQATGSVSYKVGTSEGTSTSSTAITGVEFGHSKAGKENYSITTVLQKIEVTEEKQAVTNADYTINYQLSGTTVKTVAGTSIIDAEITADVAIDGTEEGYVGNHYLITAAEAPSMTLVADAASNVLNVPVRAPYTATLNVTRIIGGVAQTPIVTELTETDAKVCSWTYTYPMYVQKDGLYYGADEISSFGETGTFTDGEIINKTVAYPEYDNGIVYYGEPNEATGLNTAYSNGSTGFVTGGVTYDSNSIIRLGKLTAGKYYLYTNITGDANRNLVVGDYTAGTEAFPTPLVTITSTGEKTEQFIVNGNQLISISGKDQGKGKFNQSATLDYILVVIDKVSKEITTAGYATFCSPYAVQFSGTGLTAYIAQKDGNNVTFKEVNSAPANTGVLLKGDANNYDFTVLAGTSVDVSGNAFTGTNSEVEVPAGAFVLMNGDKGVGFYKTKNAFTVGANTAYIPADVAPARSFIGFDEATAIKAVESVKAENGAFNLRGQRVKNLTKGLYIVNGKKVVK